MQIGSPFNPYRVFQGVFAPYWILEHRGIRTGSDRLIASSAVTGDQGTSAAS